MSRQTIICVAILALSAVVLLMVVSRQPREPVSHGFPLSYWLVHLDKMVEPVPNAPKVRGPVLPHPDWQERQTARNAIKEMGTNALPVLTLMLRRHDSPMRKRFVSWLDGHPWLKSELNLRPPAEESLRLALDGITCLGPAGQPALANVTPLVTNQISAVRIKAIFALTSIAPKTETVLPVVPNLMQALGDGNWTIQVAAMNALAALRPTPPEAMPAFVRLAKDSDRLVSDAAMVCLVSQTNPLAIPLLNQRLQSKDSYVVTKAAAQIAIFGAAAAASEPRLTQLLDDPLLTVRRAATNALISITGQPRSHSPPDETANITLDFPVMPLQAFFGYYESLAGKKVAIKALPKPGQCVRVSTPRALTKSEALALFDEVLKEQAGLIIVHEKDGSLTAIAKP